MILTAPQIDQVPVAQLDVTTNTLDKVGPPLLLIRLFSDPGQRDAVSAGFAVARMCVSQLN